jgi:uncharacterized delta-60 repeat protein
MKKLLTSLIFVAVLLPVIHAYGQDGTNDPTFNSINYPGVAANEAVYTTAIQSDGKTIIGGDFTSYNGTTSIGVARLNADGTLDPTFNSGSGPNGSVLATAIQSDGKIIIGGSFTYYNNIAIPYIARLNADGSLDASFNNNGIAGSHLWFNGSILSVSLQSNGMIIVGGSFTYYFNEARNGIARLNANGTLDASFTVGLGANNTVYTTAVQSDGKILIGGLFTSYNGIARKGMARLNTNGSLDASFYVGTWLSGSPYTIVVQSNGMILIGGNLLTSTGIGNVVRLNSSGTLDPFFNNIFGTGANSLVNTMAIQSDGKIVIGGDFTSYNGTTRNNLARLNIDGSLDASFQSVGPPTNIGGISSASIQSDGRIIFGGNFASYNGTTRNYIARMNTDGTIDANFNGAGTGVNGTIHATVIQSDGKIIIGGEFTVYNDTPTNNIARLNTDGSLDASFNVGMGTNSSIITMAIQSDGKIVIGGYFSNYNGIARDYIARLNTDGSLDASFIVGGGTNGGVVSSSIQSDGKIIIAGNFTYYNGTAINNIARLNANGGLDASFAVGTGANNPIYTTSIQSDGKIVIGGDFTSYNGITRNYIARLNTDGTLDASFAIGTGASYYVSETAIQSDGKIIMSGLFSSYNGIAQKYLARLNTDGSLDASFNIGTGVNNVVTAISVQSNGKIIIGGAFTSYNGNTRNYITRLNTDGTLDASFNTSGTGANNPIYTTSIQSDGKIIIGGYFTNYNGRLRNYIARLYDALCPGTSMQTAIPITTWNSCVGYTDTENNGTCFTNTIGQPSPDIYYTFSLGQVSDINISTCGSVLNDTYLHLLNSQGTEIDHDDDNGPSCSSLKASLAEKSLAAGTYYIVAEGFGYGTGVITLNVWNADYCLHIIYLGRLAEKGNLFKDTVSTIASEVMLYPNPTRGNVSLRIPQLQETTIITISDVYGSVLYQIQTNSVETEINTSTLASGIYFMTFQFAHETVTKKLEIQK